MFYTMDDALRLSKMFRRMPCEVSEELRGWNWNEYPLAPPSFERISVNDFSSGFCENDRFLYVKYVKRARYFSDEALEEGAFIHKVYSEACRCARAVLYSIEELSGEGFRVAFLTKGPSCLEHLLKGAATSLNVDRAKAIFGSLWTTAANTYAAALDRLLTRSRHMARDGLAASAIPLITEFPIDGSPLGLGMSIRADALLMPSTIVELKVGDPSPHDELGLAAYSLAFEAQFEVPINYGVLVYLRFNSDGSRFNAYERLVAISDGLRMRFVERRDRALRVLEEKIDPGLPANCHPHCPYLKVCSSDAG